MEKDVDDDDDESTCRTSKVMFAHSIEDEKF